MNNPLNQEIPIRAVINKIIESRQTMGRVLFYGGGMVGLVLTILFLLNPFPDYHSSGTHADFGAAVAFLFLYGFAAVSILVSLITAVWKGKAVLNFWMGLGCLVAGGRLLSILNSFGEASLGFLSNVSLLGGFILLTTAIGLVLLVCRWGTFVTFVNKSVEKRG